MQFRASGYLCQCKEVSGVPLYLPLSALSSFFIPLAQMGESNFLSRLLAPSPPPPFPRSPPLSPPQPTKETAGSWGSILDRCLREKNASSIYRCPVCLTCTSLHFKIDSPNAYTRYSISFPFPFLFAIFSRYVLITLHTFYTLPFFFSFHLHPLHS